MVKRASPKRRPHKAKPGTKGLGPAECRLTEPLGTAAELVQAIERVGGCVVGSYKEPLGGHPVLVSILPIEAVEPTPFQREIDCGTRSCRSRGSVANPRAEHRESTQS